MTRTTKILVAVALTAAAGAGYWFLLLAPKQDEIAALDEQIAAKHVEVERSRQLMATYEAAKDSYKANYATLARLGKAVPADDDVRSLLVQIDATAERSGVDFGKIEVGGSNSVSAEPGAAAAEPAEGELAPPPGTVPFGDSGFSAMPFSFSFTGSYFELSTFLARLERFVRVQNENIGVNGRLLRLESVQLQPVNVGSPTLRAEIAAATYIVPPADDLPGVTPASPDGGPPASTESAVTPPDVPTATATGATP
jgi:Tfp pilus assembly protein PilO